MLFSSITFLFAFLPIVLFLYYISPRFLKNTVLVIVSLAFYAWGEPRYIVIMLCSIIVGYLMGILTEKFKNAEEIGKARAMMILAVVINLGILVFFKYTNFFVENINNIPGVTIKMPHFPGIAYTGDKINLPLGISFYTFQILSYSVDVYRGTVKAQRNIINLAAYITLFPQLIAGPIVRYETVEKELVERRESVDMFGEGASRFVMGLGKKVLIANMAGEIFNNLSSLGADDNTVILSWICSIAFTLQIYFDFSGYSDMAIGLGRMLGFNFLENFDYPYISKSITEFWRRWHISLSSWFRDYVYIPLGGNRKGKFKTFRNIFIVWLLTGFWHGAAWNFIFWGLYYFVLLMIEKNFLLDKLKKAPAVLSHIYSLFLINIGWVIFAYDDVKKLKDALLNMFFANGLAVANDLTIFYILSYGLFLLIAFAVATPYPKKLADKIFDKLNGIPEVIFLLAVFVLSTAFLASESFNPFLYFRF